MRLGERHCHIHVCAAALKAASKIGTLKRVAGVHDQIDLVFFCQCFDQISPACIHPFNGEPVLVFQLCLNFLTAFQVIVGKNYLLHPCATPGNCSYRLSHSACAYE